MRLSFLRHLEGTVLRYLRPSVGLFEGRRLPQRSYWCARLLIYPVINLTGNSLQPGCATLSVRVYSSRREGLALMCSSNSARARYINSWGLDRPRLDRLQGLADFTSAQLKTSIILKTGDYVCLLLSRGVFTRLTSMWNGRVVYQRHWNAFFEDMRAEWLRVAGLVSTVCLNLQSRPHRNDLTGCCHLAVNFVGGECLRPRTDAIFLFCSGSTIMLASGRTTLPLIVCTALSGTSVFISLVLFHKHGEDALATGPDIVRLHLCRI